MPRERNISPCFYLISFFCKCVLGDLCFILSVQNGVNNYEIGSTIIFWCCILNCVRRWALSQKFYNCIITMFTFISCVITFVVSAFLENARYNFFALGFGIIFQVIAIHNDYEVAQTSQEERTVVPIVTPENYNFSNSAPIPINVTSQTINFISIIHSCDNCACECSICYESICQKIIITLNCKHTFHKTCILTWFKSIDELSPDRSKTYKNLSCPLCRQNQVV